MSGQDTNPLNDGEVEAVMPQEPLDSAKRSWTSDELFGPEREVLITHGDDVYRLRKTRTGKLILHK